MLWMETIVCSSKKGTDARLRRMLKARQEFKRRQKGCIGAWMGQGPQDATMILVQSVFKSQEDWNQISTLIQSTFDSKDGGVEALLLGPPLVGIFELEPSEMQSMDFSDIE
jgi:hypothetical protein